MRSETTLVPDVKEKISIEHDRQRWTLSESLECDAGPLIREENMKFAGF